MVVVLPTGVDGYRAAAFCPDRNPCGNATLHAAAAAVLIRAVIGYALYFFVREPRLRYWQAVATYPIKTRYIAMGVVIILMLARIALAVIPVLRDWLSSRLSVTLLESVFWPEAIVVCGFGTAWILKGCMMRTARRQVARYTASPIGGHG